MKIAVLLAGEMRTFNEPEVLASYYKYLFDKYDCDLFISTWSKKGKSNNHGAIQFDSSVNTEINETSINKTYPNIKGILIEDYDAWCLTLDEYKKNILVNGFTWHECIVKGSGIIGQFYKLKKANDMKILYEQQHNFKYDIVVRTRPDNIFLTSPSFLIDNSLHAINCEGHYWANRVYDIFFYSSSDKMDLVCNSYDNLSLLIDNPFKNGLHTLDICRLFYVSCLINDINVEDIKENICVIRR